MPDLAKNLLPKPIVLTVSGHDPSGGAGIQADAEVITHFGCHPCSIITCLTVQDSQTVHRLIPINADDLLEQAHALFNDMDIAVIKIGLTGSIECVNAISTILEQHKNIPVIFDPVLACGDGTPLADKQLIDAIRTQLIPLTTVLTPNSIEAQQLSELPTGTSLDELGSALTALGAQYVLITGGHDVEADIINRLYKNTQCVLTTTSERLDGEYHGTGCTLASAIAALIAQGDSMMSAVEQASTYTCTSVKHAQQMGKGQRFPNRSQHD